jgi:hypothetical protein
MRNRIFGAFFLVFLAGLLSAALAQNSPTTTRVKTSKDPTPTWTAKGHYYGFVTCDKIRRQGNQASVDAIKKCVADGGKYVFTNTPLDNDKAAQAILAPFAGQYVDVIALKTSPTYGTGPTSDASIDGLYAGGDRPATRVEGISVVSAKIDPTPDPSEGRPAAGGPPRDANGQLCATNCVQPGGDQ